MSPDDLVALNDQLAGMARAGLPLDRGLASLAADMGRGRLRRATEELADDLRAGRPLPEALARLGPRVPAYYPALVEAGVRTGRLPDVLVTLTGYARAVAATRAAVADALIYPAVLLAFGSALMAVVVVWVLPQFDATFREYGFELPWLTRAVLEVSRRPELYLGLPAAVAVGGPVVTWAVLSATPAGRRTWARLVYAVPVAGTLVRSARLAAFADLLAVLVDHGVPLPEAFRLAGRAAADPEVAHQAERAADRLAAGAPLGEALGGGGLVPQWVAWMAGAGADRNELAATLRQIAGVYRRQVESRAVLLRTVLPPFLVLVVGGGLAAGFTAALLLPFVKLLEGLSRW